MTTLVDSRQRSSNDSTASRQTCLQRLLSRSAAYLRVRPCQGCVNMRNSFPVRAGPSRHGDPPREWRAEQAIRPGDCLWQAIPLASGNYSEENRIKTTEPVGRRRLLTIKQMFHTIVLSVCFIHSFENPCS